MSLLDVKHQMPAQRMLQRAMARNRVPHAYIFHGPDGVGKETLAIGLAQRLLCEQPATQPIDADRGAVLDAEQIRVGCGACKSCRLVASDTHPDLHLIHRLLHREHPDPEVRKRKGQSLSIDVIRHFLIAPAGLMPAQGHGKVFLLREADLLEPPAQNALLKTLEEPPPNTFIVLLVRSLDRMLPTTLSRCQLVPFGPLTVPFVESQLAALRADCPVDHRTWCARACDGSLGRALQWVDDCVYEVNEHVVNSLIRSRPDQLPATVKSWTETAKTLAKILQKRDPEMTDAVAARSGFRTLFQLAAIFFADIVKVSVGGSAEPANIALIREITQCAERIDPEQAAAAVRRIAKAEHHLARYLNTNLSVESLLGDLSHVLRGETIDVL